MLGLEPLGEHLVVEPALPRAIGLLALLNVPGRWGATEVFECGGVGKSRRCGWAPSSVTETNRTPTRRPRPQQLPLVF